MKNTVILLHNCAGGTSLSVCGEERSQPGAAHTVSARCWEMTCIFTWVICSRGLYGPGIPPVDSCWDSFHHFCIAVLCVCPRLISWLTRAKCRSVSCQRFLSLVKNNVAAELIRNECAAETMFKVPFEKDTEHKYYSPSFVLASLRCCTHFPPVAFGFH